jgi:hypothetical protein
MRTLLLIAATTFGATGIAVSQQAKATSTPSGLECVNKLATPDFPQAALQAHVDGSVWTWMQVTPQGTADKITNQVVSAYGDGPKLLTPATEKALKDSKFKTSCAGKTVSVVFRYELHGEPTGNPKVTTRNEPPNIVYIESQPESTVSAKNSGPRK